MSDGVIAMKCAAQRRQCRDNGHGTHVLALREWCNGSQHVYEICESCGQSLTSCGLRRKDHPNWAEYPVLDESAPQNFGAGCRCGLCMKEWAEVELRRRDAERRAEWRDANFDTWVMTASRLRSERNAVMTWDDYERYRSSPEWRALRERVMERFGGRCAACNGNQSLDVHHRTYVRVGHENLSDLTLLCAQCHEVLHAVWSDNDITLRYEGPSIAVGTRP